MARQKKTALKEVETSAGFDEDGNPIENYGEPMPVEPDPAPPEHSDDEIYEGKEMLPPRIVLYGTHGIGKSTFPTQAPDPIFIPTEDGLRHLNVKKFPVSKTFDEFWRRVDSLLQEKYTYKTVVIDTLDWLQNLIFMEVGNRNNKKFSDIGFGKGYKEALEIWHQVLDLLDRLNQEKNMSVVLLAHAKVEKFQSPNLDPYDKYQPDIDERAVGMLQEWADAVFFVNYKIHTVTVDESFGKKVKQAVGGERRVLYTQEQPAFYAKNRYYMPPEIPFLWKAVVQAIADNAHKVPVDILTDELPDSFA